MRRASESETMKTSELLDLIEAEDMGDQLQYFDPNEGIGVWRDCKLDDIIENLPQMRSKAEPREWWINIYEGGSESWVVHDSKERADKDHAKGRLQLVHVREVVDET